MTFSRLLCSLSLLVASVSHAGLSVTEALTRYQAMTGVSVTGLDQDQLNDLLAGETIYRTVKLSDDQDRSNTIIRIVGYRLIDAPREPLWLAALAYDGNFSPRLTEYLASSDEQGYAVWYQHVDMPWPLRDRHWLIRTSKNLPLAEATENAIWEHHWGLADDSYARISEIARRDVVDNLSREDFRRAVILPRNNGAWVMTEVSANQTLVVLHATMDMGGMVPDGLVARSTRKQLRKMLTKIEADAGTAYDNYDGRYAIYRGDGSLIKPRQQGE